MSRRRRCARVRRNIAKNEVAGVVDVGAREGVRHVVGAPGVHVLDPFVGTGNFLLSVMREIPQARIEKKYDTELHANEAACSIRLMRELPNFGSQAVNRSRIDNRRGV